MTRFTYASGYKTREAAEAALEDMFAFDEVSECERPKVEGYDAWVTPQAGQPLTTARRYCITLSDA